MNSILHKSETRGYANHGWLEARHSFSFANYYNPDRLNFGVLRVLNDDIIAPGAGFPQHPHDNMEIITIPLSGAIAHKDSMGNSSVINTGEIQVMSAGKGIFHSEFNHNKDKELRLFQIWVIPNKKNIEPRYDQISIKHLEKKNELFQILSPNTNDQGVWIHQDAWFNLGYFDEESNTTYELHNTQNGVYIIVIEGSININNHRLNEKDAIGVWDTENIDITVHKDSKFLLMELPL